MKEVWSLPSSQQIAQELNSVSSFQNGTFSCVFWQRASLLLGWNLWGLAPVGWSLQRTWWAFHQMDCCWKAVVEVWSQERQCALCQWWTLHQQWSCKHSLPEALEHCFLAIESFIRLEKGSWKEANKDADAAAARLWRRVTTCHSGFLPVKKQRKASKFCINDQ